MKIKNKTSWYDETSLTNTLECIINEIPFEIGILLFLKLIVVCLLGHIKSVSMSVILSILYQCCIHDQQISPAKVVGSMIHYELLKTNQKEVHLLLYLLSENGLKKSEFIESSCKKDESTFMLIVSTF